MNAKLKAFVEETLEEMATSVPKDKLLQRITPEFLRENLPLADRLQALSQEEMLNNLTEVVRTLSPEKRAALLRELNAVEPVQTP